MRSRHSRRHGAAAQQAGTTGIGVTNWGLQMEGDPEMMDYSREAEWLIDSNKEEATSKLIEMSELTEGKMNTTHVSPMPLVLYYIGYSIICVLQLLMCMCVPIG